jgi:hypothetical protein
MTDDTPRYNPTDRLTRQEAAAVLGISVSMLAHYRRTEQISAEKNTLTGAVRFVYADILALKTRREETGDRVIGKQGTKPLPTNIASHVANHRAAATARLAAKSNR